MGYALRSEWVAWWLARCVCAMEVQLSQRCAHVRVAQLWLRLWCMCGVSGEHDRHVHIWWRDGGRGVHQWCCACHKVCSWRGHEVRVRVVWLPCTCTVTCWQSRCMGPCCARASWLRCVGGGWSRASRQHSHPACVWLHLYGCMVVRCMGCSKIYIIYLKYIVNIRIYALLVPHHLK